MRIPLRRLRRFHVYAGLRLGPQALLLRQEDVKEKGGRGDRSLFNMISSVLIGVGKCRDFGRNANLYFFRYLCGQIDARYALIQFINMKKPYPLKIRNRSLQKVCRDAGQQNIHGSCSCRTPIPHTPKEDWFPNLVSSSVCLLEKKNPKKNQPKNAKAEALRERTVLSCAVQLGMHTGLSSNQPLD